MEILSLTSETFAIDLSGHLAAASSIFLNCQGKREGYKKGRKSNRLSSGLYCSYTAFSDGQYPQSIHATPAYRMVRWREGRHLMPVPRVLEEEMLDLLRDLRINSQHMSIRSGLSKFHEPVEGIEPNPIRAQAS